MRPAHITAHAVERYQQRVANLPDDAVIQALNSPAILTAIQIGARAVQFGTGHRAIIADGKVVTVAPKPLKKRCRRGKR